MKVPNLGKVRPPNCDSDEEYIPSIENEALRLAARRLLRVLPESEIELAHFVWGNTNVALVLAARKELADLVGGV